MPIGLDTRDADFEHRFRALLAAKREVSEDVDAAVATILADVRERGDAAVQEASLRFDKLDPTVHPLRIEAAEIAAAADGIAPEAMAALRFAHERIIDFHRRQLPKDLRYTDALGVSWVGAGPPSKPSVSTCPVAPPAIPLRF